MEMQDLMQQAQQLQSRVAAAQEKLENTTVRGIADNGACVVEMTGKYDLVSLKLRDDITTHNANEISQIVLDALRDAKSKADEVIDNVMSDATAGLPLPK